MLYFAIVNNSESFNSSVHSREDLTVFSLKISQAEGEFAKAEMEILNTRSAIIERKLFISQDGQLLFTGFITTVPRGAINETISIEALARPANSDDRIAILMETLKTAPQYDPLFVPEGSENDPAEVLTGWGRVLTWSRTAHSVDTVDVLGAGAPTLIATPLAGSVSIDVADIIPKTARVEASVQWNQEVRRSFNLQPAIFTLDTMTPQNLIENFPRPGQEIAAGFRVEKAEIIEAQPENREKIRVKREIDPDELDPAFIEEGEFDDIVEIADLSGVLTVSSSHSLRRIERAMVELTANVQEILGSDTVETETITLRDITFSNEYPSWQPRADYIMGDHVIRGGRVYEALRDHRSSSIFSPAQWQNLGVAAYIASRTSPSFFKSERGLAAAEHMKHRAAARLRYLSRAVQVSFQCKIPNLAAITDNKTMTITDPRLPSGSVTGKIIEYSLNWNDGSSYADIKIACSVGQGGDSLPNLNPPENEPEEPRVDFAASVQNRATVQRTEFSITGTISPTVIELIPTAPDVKDYEFSAAFSANSTILLPRQYSVS